MNRQELIRYYTELPYRTEIHPDDCEGSVAYMAVHTELSGCKAQGATPDEALVNLADARTEYITALVDSGLDVPVPAGMVHVQYDPQWPTVFYVQYAVQSAVARVAVTRNCSVAGVAPSYPGFVAVPVQSDDLVGTVCAQ
ncbi:MAG TPA: type II toxin-antitoxin system HicB family antitoxin [Chthonomonadales bacterium]|nr:type II toxin-antitoxin system HicB family antitoxin [Chthonomonadales bacterium]